MLSNKEMIDYYNNEIKRFENNPDLPFAKQNIDELQKLKKNYQ